MSLLINTSNSHVLNFLPLNAGRISSVPCKFSTSSAVLKYKINRTVTSAVKPVNSSFTSNYLYHKYLPVVSKYDTKRTSMSYRYAVRKYNSVLPITATQYATTVPAIRVKVNTVTVNIPDSNLTYRYDILAAKFLDINPISSNSISTCFIVMCKPSVCTIEHKNSTVVYKANRYKFVDIITTALGTSEFLTKEVLLYVDDYLKIDLCTHKAEEEPLYATDKTSLFFL